MLCFEFWTIVSQMLGGVMQIEKTTTTISSAALLLQSIFHGVKIHAWTAAAALVLAEIEEGSQNAGGQTVNHSKKL